MNNLLVVFKKNHEQVHDGALSTVISTLDKAKQTYGFDFRTVPREEVERDDFVGPEAVIVLGGDGTLTSIAHSVDDRTLVMGVNSHPMDSGGSGSFGFFMGSDPTRFPEDLNRLLRGSCIINTIPRLQAEIMSTSGKHNQIRPRIERSSCGQHTPVSTLEVSTEKSEQPQLSGIRREAIFIRITIFYILGPGCMVQACGRSEHV